MKPLIIIHVTSEFHDQFSDVPVVVYFLSCAEFVLGTPAVAPKPLVPMHHNV